ncbi:MAG TPA: DUF4157 domain-containing protein [Rhizomicrobium sp.]|jgi:hypothetical protein
MRALSVFQKKAAASAAAMPLARPLERRAQSQDTGHAGEAMGAPLPLPLRSGLESVSGIDLSGVRVHRDSTKPAALDALAFTQGRQIHLAPGEERHLPHEGWHAVQQLSGRVPPNAASGLNDDSALEAEADRMGALASTARFGPAQSLARPAEPHGAPIQRMVRTGGGKAHVREADFQPGGPKASVGTRFSVASLIADPLKRIFNDTAELEAYANGSSSADHIGDVAPSAAPKVWYRLPRDKLTVLGERHEDANGNAEDVIVGLHTSRFKYEALNEAADVAGLSTPGTRTRLGQVNTQYRVAGQINRAAFNPDLENIIFKVMGGVSLTREFLRGNPPAMSGPDRALWGKRPSTSAWSQGERTALYLSMGIHIAKDFSAQSFGPPNSVELPVVSSARDLKTFYAANQPELDALMQAKDADPLTGIYELVAAGGFTILAMLTDFTLALHDYCTQYVQQIGTDTGNKRLQSEGARLGANPDLGLDQMNTAREEIMWAKVKEAKDAGFLVVGMGDEHRKNLAPRVAAAAGIVQENVLASLKRQKAEVESAWSP